MVGSRDYFTYVDDLNNQAGVLLLDTSNTLAIQNATPASQSEILAGSVDKRIEPRVYEFRSSDRRTTRRCVCLSLSSLSSVPGTITVKDEDGGDITLYLARYTGEQEGFPVPDGDSQPDS